ncbi:heparinase II/III family protein [Jeotgalibacillus campisalis]|uniref:Uncharacterized protein n=1 Tax=Jeotgalibacillus campisalis TaxID=220754 RepID=A0A0C2VGM8_9BACL|nr:heparinase II/III family protein [Jeotgalibacillus campisalis]KIL43163.1 hypothetical protein KR50_35660 [Jeotgalibacillus campisalis]
MIHIKPIKVLIKKPHLTPLKVVRFLKKRVFINTPYKRSPLNTKTKKFVPLIENEHLLDLKNKGEFIKDANEIIKGNLNFIFLRDIKIELNDVNFKKDYKNNIEWKNQIYSKITLGDNKKSDIKNVWELNRLQFLLRLSQAYKLTLDEKYINLYIKVFEKWYSQNPIKIGPNWMNAMEVSIRLTNLCVSFDLIKNDLSNKNTNFVKLVEISINEHLDYIDNNLEWNPLGNGNHYISNLCGFIFGSVYGKHKKYKKYIKLAVKELEREMYKQTLDDGSNFEKSYYYHRLVLEMCLYTYILLKKNKINNIDQIGNLISKMSLFSNSIIKEDGTTPQYGDNDSGIFLPICPSWYNNLLYHKHLIYLSKAAGLSEDLVLENISSSDLICNQLCLIFPKSSISNNMKFHGLNNSSSIAVNYPNFGVFIYKDPKIYFNFYYGEVGQSGNGGHSHNDRLSFYLSYKGKEIFVDPGTGSYTRSINERKYFRSAISHNSVTLDNYEYNKIPNNPFKTIINSDPSEIIIKDDVNYISVESTNKVKYFDKEYKHKREIKIDKIDYTMFIYDEISGDKLAQNFDYINVNFILSPKIKINDFDDKNNSCLLDNNIFVSSEYGWVKNIEKYSYSPYYGSILNTSKIKYTKNIKSDVISNRITIKFKEKF